MSDIGSVLRTAREEEYYVGNGGKGDQYSQNLP